MVEQGTEKASADVGSQQTVLPPVFCEATVRSVQDTSKNGKDVHLAELNTKSNHQRLPSVGDFQVGDTTTANARGRVDLDTSANRNSVHHRDVSPPNRPTNIPQWRSFDKEMLLCHRSELIHRPEILRTVHSM